MPRGDGLEMRSAISIAALSLHYLHLLKFWRSSVEYSLDSGSASRAAPVLVSGGAPSTTSLETISTSFSAVLSSASVKLGTFRINWSSSSLYASFIIDCKTFVSIFLSGNHVLTLISSFLSKSASFR